MWYLLSYDNLYKQEQQGCFPSSRSRTLTEKAEGWKLEGYLGVERVICINRNMHYCSISEE